jgi:hypothetical protein
MPDCASTSFRSAFNTLAAVCCLRAPEPFCSPPRRPTPSEYGVSILLTRYSILNFRATGSDQSLARDNPYCLLRVRSNMNRARPNTNR